MHNGELIRKYREEKGLSRDKFGKLAGLSGCTILRIEAGKSVSKTTLKRVENVLNGKPNKAQREERPEVISEKGKEILKKYREMSDKSLGIGLVYGVR